MFKKVLVANRGEIALRVIRACHEMGIQTVAVHSEADIDSLHVRFADQVVCIGPPAVGESYLNISRIISAAEITGADAIHPGYGFLAENAHFAEVCEECGIRFIGPPAEVIRLFGDKVEARRVMAKAGVPTVPGSDGAVPDALAALRVAREVGYPVIVKAVYGGGGRGMRVAREDDELSRLFPLAQAEAEAAFGYGDLYIEHYVENPRHVEVQLLGDADGEVLHFGERDCTIQRRHQKLLEESPSPALDAATRRQLCETAARGAKSAGYRNAGTAEFLLDQDGRFFFMEMNARIQVEHPVTEMVTRTDLVKAQIRVASGAASGFRQAGIHGEGHAIECRINAEDPRLGFRPAPGKVTIFYPPGGPGVRVDTHVYPEYSIPRYYDSLIAKLIVHGADRAEAIQRMDRALSEFIIEGVATTIPFHRALLANPQFRSAEISTAFVETFDHAGV